VGPKACLGTVMAKKKIPAPTRDQIPLVQSVATHFTDKSRLLMSLKQELGTFIRTLHLILLGGSN
jgi:hypothetical protein